MIEIIILFVAVAVLAVAQVGLFAMNGELASRVEDLSLRMQGDTSLIPINDWAEQTQDVDVGWKPHRWPPELSGVAKAPASLIIVLSTSCSSCVHFARGDLSLLDNLKGCSLAFVISCPSSARADHFVRQHPSLNDHGAVFADVKGD